MPPCRHGGCPGRGRSGDGRADRYGGADQAGRAPRPDHAGGLDLRADRDPGRQHRRTASRSCTRPPAWPDRVRRRGRRTTRRSLSCTARCTAHSVGALTAWKRRRARRGRLAALMSIFVVIRHTRADEEAGRLELVGSAAVGRQARARRRPAGRAGAPTSVLGAADRRGRDRARPARGRVAGAARWPSRAAGSCSPGWPRWPPRSAGTARAARGLAIARRSARPSCCAPSATRRARPGRAG